MDVVVKYKLGDGFVCFNGSSPERLKTLLERGPESLTLEEFRHAWVEGPDGARHEIPECFFDEVKKALWQPDQTP